MSAVLNLNDLRLFVRVVEWGGFAPASRALRLPKSTLSKRVGELERSLKVTLIRRTTRQFAVTPVGRELHRHAVEMVSLAEAAEAAVRGRTAEPSGLVALTCSVPTAQGWLSRVVPELLDQYPKLELKVHATDRFVDVVREGFDIAVRDHLSPLPDSSLVQRRIDVDPVWLVASPVWLRRRRVRHPSELVAGELLGSDSTWSLSRSDEVVTVDVAGRLSADESSVLLTAVRAGLGVAAVAASLCQAGVRSGALRRVLPEWTAGEVSSTLLMPDRRAQLPAVRAVADALAAARRGRGGR
ncbi:MAG: LysR family transcriptional regulator [Myxococcaceae bacterium]|nr:LysR family transcriptional regulator [Myxococcaceae bacterium]